VLGYVRQTRGHAEGAERCVDSPSGEWPSRHGTHLYGLMDPKTFRHTDQSRPARGAQRAGVVAKPRNQHGSGTHAVHVLRADHYSVWLTGG